MQSFLQRPAAEPKIAMKGARSDIEFSSEDKHFICRDDVAQEFIHYLNARMTIVQPPKPWFTVDQVNFVALELITPLEEAQADALISAFAKPNI